MRIYIAGPISEQPELNLPAFTSAAEQLTAIGHTPVIPHEYTDTAWSWEECIKAVLPHMLLCSGIALLDGYQNSRGAMIELELAERVKIPCKPLEEWL